MRDWLPYLSEETDDAIVIVCLAYAGCLSFLIMLSLALHNIIVFLVGQSRWKVLPLLFFYMMTVIVLTYIPYSAQSSKLISQYNIYFDEPITTLILIWETLDEQRNHFEN